MTKHSEDTPDLEPLFEAARANALEPSPDFMARLMNDAEAGAALNAAPPETAPPTAHPGVLTRLVRALLPVSGLTAATAAGVWIGVGLPDTDIASALLFGADSEVDLSAFLPASDLSQFSTTEVDG